MHSLHSGGVDKTSRGEGNFQFLGTHTIKKTHPHIVKIIYHTEYNSEKPVITLVKIIKFIRN